MKNIGRECEGQICSAGEEHIYIVKGNNRGLIWDRDRYCGRYILIVREIHKQRVTGAQRHREPAKNMARGIVKHSNIPGWTQRAGEELKVQNYNYIQIKVI